MQESFLKTVCDIILIITIIYNKTFKLQTLGNCEIYPLNEDVRYEDVKMCKKYFCWKLKSVR